MRRVIYIPAVEEQIPDIWYHCQLPVSGDFVFDVLVDDKWDTDGVVKHEMLEDRTIITQLPEPAVHHYAGWEF